MQRASTLDQSIDRILREIGIQKVATAPPIPAVSTGNPLRKIAEALRTFQEPELSYEDLHAVKRGTFHIGPTPPPTPKLAGSGTVVGLRKVAHALRVADYDHRVKTARDAENVLRA